MKSWKNILVSPKTTILKTIETINTGALQLSLVINSEGKLLGTVTDGDIRRGILRGLSLEEPIERVMNTNPMVVRENEANEHIWTLMKRKRYSKIPVLDVQGRLVDLKMLDEPIETTKQDNWVVLMAGGMGTRLQPLTNDCPKPLLKVGSKPILETILENFIEDGFHKFYLSVNYKSEMIKDYFGDGSRWGVTIRYIDENERLGTAGALSLLSEKLKTPVIVMNGDLLTKVNFQQLLHFHLENQSKGTMCVINYDYQVPFGVIQTVGHHLLSIEEKPSKRYFVNAGIYVLDPEVISLIPQGKYYDMPELFKLLIDKNKETIVFPIREYWLDIGRLDDFEKANMEFMEVFG
jgi:dTDP-glucose pyrophosphorylase